jgi:hypothetical protein
MLARLALGTPDAGIELEMEFAMGYRCLPEGESVSTLGD